MLVASMTKQTVSVGRIVHVYSNLWIGPRAGLVANAFPGSHHANVNVFAYGANEQEWLASIRASESGNTLAALTLAALPIYDLLSDTPETLLEQGGVSYTNPDGSLRIKAVAVWPPRV